MRTSRVLVAAPLAVFASQALGACGSGGADETPSDGGGGAADTAVHDGGETGSADVAAPGDDSGSTSSATTYFITVMSLQPGLCLGMSLPTDADGQAPCQLFVELAAGDSCSAHASLSPAAPDVLASLRASGDVLTTSNVCVLPQLPEAEWVNGSCASSAQAGWCYVKSPSAGKCTQTILLSPSGAPPAGAGALLGCGEAPPGTVASGATSAARVGTRCVPSPELSASFADFQVNEITVDEGNAACGGAVCLVNHFRGRTTCPYGQDASGNPPPGFGSACTVPGAGTPVQPNDPVAGDTVLPQCLDRRAADTVYCSCRCANVAGRTDDGASYCSCPSGYSCSQVVPAIAAGDPRSGGYCIKTGTAFDPTVGACANRCDPALNNCSNP
jgi:hypothetical protein